jgi:hypothetical protein
MILRNFVLRNERKCFRIKLKNFPQFFQKVYTREEIGSNLWQQCNIKNDNKIGEMFTLHTGSLFYRSYHKLFLRHSHLVETNVWKKILCF